MHIYNEHKNLPKEARDEFEKPPCESCGITEESPGVLLTEHHVYPQRWSWKDHLTLLAVWLCQECHGELEHEIFIHERQFGNDKKRRNRLQHWFYPNITLDFITQPSITD